MIKIITILFIYINVIFAHSFNFTELRYSYAIDRSIQLDGQINFLKNGLSISYHDSAKSLRYENNTLIYKENNETIDLDAMQYQKIKGYFDILILLYKDDKKAYDGIFDIEIKDDKTILKPLGDIKEYISHIEMFKEKTKLKQIKLFLKNRDNITIIINDEI